MAGPTQEGSWSAKDFRIAVIGGGVCGLVLAVALIERGVHVDIYEAAPVFGEIGAGVAFGPNAARALSKCSPSLLDAFNKVATKNHSPDKKFNWFDWMDGYHASKQDGWRFCLKNDLGANSVHRAHFLEEMIKLLPEGISHFGKRLEDIGEPQNGRITMKFADGTSAVANAVIGCDGIKSKTRQIILGPGHPSLRPVYTHKYAYRGLIPIEKASEALGDDIARNAYMHMGKDGHILTFPVNKGAIMNVVAFKVDRDKWPNEDKLTLPTTKSQALSDFSDFGGSVSAILNLLDDSLDRWAIYDLGDAPLPTYYKKLVCLVGDSAHATSPHHGAGAGLGIEDAAVLAELLAMVIHGQPIIGSMRRTYISAIASNVEMALEAYDTSRRERTQWLVQSSRRTGDLYEWRAEGVGEDISKIYEELKWRCEKIWDGDIERYVQDAKDDLQRRLQSAVSSEKL